MVFLVSMLELIGDQPKRVQVVYRKQTNKQRKESIAFIASGVFSSFSG